jgi:simple sugar transport system ATP-binding protein
LFGQGRPIQGELLLYGKSFHPNHAWDAIVQGIASIPADRKEEGLLMDRTVAENAVLVILDRLTSALGLITTQKIEQSIDPYLASFRVRASSLSTPVVQLSGGNQQKVVLTKWLARSPRLLLLNDPTRGVDIGAKHEVHNAVRELADTGVSVMMWSSDAGEMLELCERILVLTHGRLFAEFDPRSTSLNQLLLAVFSETVDDKAVAN